MNNKELQYTMNTIRLGRKVAEYYHQTAQLEQVTTEQSSTLAKYLCHLAVRYPEQVDYSELSAVLGVSTVQVSRVTRTLHVWSSKGEPGLNLVDVMFDPKHPRIKLVQLNAKGLSVLNKIFIK